jgi:hypothetical protein
MPQYLIVSAIAGVLFLLSWGVIFYLFRKIRQCEFQLALVHDNLLGNENKLNQVNDELHETRIGNQALGRKVKDLVRLIGEVQSRQEKLAEQDPQSRFYANAVKLITDGASLEDVMRECDLPRAEAELLFSLHQS